MNSFVAIIGAESLSSALNQQGISSRLCPEAEPRARLRWVMDLDPQECRLCVVHDNDGKTTAALITALDPSIPALAWATQPPDLPRLALALQDSPVALSLAATPELLANWIALLYPNSASSPAQARGPASAPTPVKSSEPPAAPTPTPVPMPPTVDEDLEAYQRLEALMAMPVKDLPKPEPVQVQQTGIDFSVPLRRLMSAGKALAHKQGHHQVVGAHYLAVLDEPYRSAFDQEGFTAAVAEDYLGRTGQGEADDAEPIISDEVFDAVAAAKGRARGEDSSCIRVGDFLWGLFETQAASATALLEECGVTTSLAMEILARFSGRTESCQTSFFAPSSLDQAGFYQFDPAQVRSVEERLKTLPGFQKAARPVPETAARKKGGSPAKAPVVPIMREAAAPPEKVEIIRLNSDFPPVDIVEQVADQLLEGQVVGFPADAFYALAADAANPAAVERLRDAAGLESNKPLGLLINSASQLKHLVRADLDALEPLLDEHWPGPLTLVFKSTGVGRHIAGGGTVAVRLPSDNTSLSILSMLGRPLAVTSWDEAPPVQTAADKLQGILSIALDGGHPPQPVVTTVIDMTTTPWTILREGEVPASAVLAFQQP